MLYTSGTILPKAIQKTSFQLVRSTSTMSNTYIKRSTFFKVPKEEDIETVLKQYEKLRKTAVKDGKPYIVSNVARRVLNTSSPISDGYTIASQSIFRNHEDHDFYDKEYVQVTAQKMAMTYLESLLD